jgi:hypothetical protein
MASSVLVAVATASAGFSASEVADLPKDAILDGIRVSFIVAACASSLAVVASSFRGKPAVEAPVGHPIPAAAGRK